MSRSLQQAIDEQIAEQLKAQRKEIAQAERNRILDEQAEQTKALQEELEEKSKKLSDMQKQEIELRKKHPALSGVVQREWRYGDPVYSCI